MTKREQLIQAIEEAPEDLVQIMLDFLHRVQINPDSKLRPFGLCKGEFTVPDDFDAPLPEDVLNAFEGQ